MHARRPDPPWGAHPLAALALACWTACCTGQGDGVGDSRADSRADSVADAARTADGSCDPADLPPGVCRCDRDCDDGNPCSEDACVLDTCHHWPLVDAACDDGDPCTADDRCDAAMQCTPATSVDCADQNPCTDDRCVAGQGCENEAQQDGTACGDAPGWACVAGDCRCTPQCTGRVCGPDGCGGACGQCAGDERCDAVGVCVAASCEPDCTGRACGPDPSCGLPCGECPSGYTCLDGACLCVPLCADRACGADGCGGSCGECTSGEACDAAGQCVTTACVPDCTGRECGPDPVCGVGCGQCAAGYTCEVGRCNCEPLCGDRECGPDVRCGTSCGSCPPGEACAVGRCVCGPDCTGRVCGDNGCGGSCGSCALGERCDAAGQCRPDDVCEPDCSGLQCGPDPSCGQSCGTCPTGLGCVSGACVCEPYCWDRECGPDPVCGESCGTCPSGERCVDGRCRCDPDCTGRVCGLDPRCGESCGSCLPGTTCVTGTCVCVPECSGRVCGDDGCGGSCGGCPSGSACTEAGQCVSVSGCADGQRDELGDTGRWPTVAACAGTFGWVSLRAARTGRACGDDIATACAAPEDLCAPGWHVCMRNGRSTDLRFRLTSLECRALARPFVAATNNCSNPPEQNPATVGCNMSEPFGCYATGWCSAPPVCGPHETTHCPHTIWAPGGTFIFGLHAGRTVDQGCGHISTSVSYSGQGTLAGVLCCRD